MCLSVRGVPTVPGLWTVPGLGWLESSCKQVCFEPLLFSLIAPRKPSVSDMLSIPRNSGLKEQALKGLVAILASPLASGLPHYCGWGQGTKTFLPPQQLAVLSRTEQDQSDRHHHDWPVSSEACQCSPTLLPPGMSQQQILHAILALPGAQSPSCPSYPGFHRGFVSIPST